MATGKNIREKFIELMYVLLYVMVMMSSDNVVDDIHEKLSKIDEFKRNIDISSSDINSIATKTENNIKVYNNSENIRKGFEDVLSVYSIWEKYKSENENEIVKLIDESGGYTEDNLLKFPKDKGVVINFINNGSLKNIEKRVNDIVDKLNEYDVLKTDDVFLKIEQEMKNFFALCTNNSVSVNDDNNAVQKDNRLVDMIYNLYYEELNISHYIRIIMDKMISNIVLDHPTFDKFELIVLPKDNKVIAGKDYEASIFLNAKDYFKIDGQIPEIRVNGREIEVEDYIGHLVFPTSKDLEFDSKGESVISLTVEYFQKNPYSEKDIEIKKEVQFIVIKQEEIEGAIEVTTKFYKRCENKYILKVVDPQIKDGLDFRFYGGNLLSYRDKSLKEIELLLYPTDDECYLVVLSNGREVNKFNFNVVDPPMPSFDILINDNVVSDGAEFYSNDLNYVSIDVVNDETFETNYPQDCTNTVHSWYIEFKDSSGKTFSQIDVEDSDRYEFTDKDKREMNKARCASIYIRVKEVFREHKDKVDGVVIDNIPLIKSFEVFGRKVILKHKFSR